MGKMQRRKGAAFERWVVRWLRERGWHAERTAPMQASTQLHCDVTASLEGRVLSVECKDQRAVPKYFYDCLEQADKAPGVSVVVAKGLRKRPIVVMYLDDWEPPK